MANNLPHNVQAYLDDLVKRLIDHLGDQLVGVYLFGSASYDAFEPGLSDLDVQAIVKTPLSTQEKQAIISHINQASLSCPATKLEFVVYAQQSVHPASRHPQFELNLNTGPNQSDHVSLDPGQEASHWFLLDIAMGRQLGRCLHGRSIDEAFGDIPRSWILDGMADSLEWHQANEVNSTNSVLNACRSWQYMISGEFSSKVNGGKWALQQEGCPDVVGKALSARKTGGKLSAHEVLELYHVVLKVNHEERQKAFV
ncbi:streptomycin 3''-adenylyltransferase [Fusarium flagelliforme]|uniref:streptomycin 3''-adenylyltransferase n=1 Tax=Fusarium flagelliforme TaxID=2675880 RepID=UPI001E8D2036|nr:streptomycin 3''-adenylyltransferase [Fusarium flagelliforme]KAH7183523.1 streptomycin 3''-adenylyltransferase [Fusarium flagelliforme]